MLLGAILCQVLVSTLSDLENCWKLHWNGYGQLFNIEPVKSCKIGKSDFTGFILNNVIMSAFYIKLLEKFHSYSDSWIPREAGIVFSGWLDLLLVQIWFWSEARWTLQLCNFSFSPTFDNAGQIEAHKVLRSILFQIQISKCTQSQLWIKSKRSVLDCGKLSKSASYPTLLGMVKCWWCCPVNKIWPDWILF